MKFFHLSDLHIGLKLMNRDLMEDQKYIFEQIAEYAEKEQPEAIVIAGDIYDKAIPSAEAVELFDWFLWRLNQAVPDAEFMIVSGNHDSAPRLNVFRGLLKRQRIHMIGIPPRAPEDSIERVVLEDSYGTVNFYLLPFVKPSMVRTLTGVDEKGNSLSYDAVLHKLIEREQINKAERNILVSHQFYLPVGADPEEMERMDSEIRTVGNIDEVRADVLERFDYGALGHIHKPMKVGRECYRYCGTPLACSVSEAGQKKGIILVEMREKGVVKTKVLPLKPLREVRVIRGTLESVLEEGCEDYVTVLLTDQADSEAPDLQDRIRHEFPNLLEIRRESVWKADYSERFAGERDLDAFELCSSFLKDLDEEERDILRDVIHTVEGVS